MIALLLVAGYATRLYPLTIDIPKALLPIDGRPLLDYITDQIDSLDGVSRTVVVSNSRFADAFRDWAKTRAGGVPITVLDDGTTENGTRLGAVGDIRFAIEHAGIDEDLLVLAGDNLFTFQLSDAFAFFRERGEDTILIGHLGPEEDARRFAVVELDENGRILHLEEKPAHPRTNTVAYAVYFYRKDTLPLIGTYLDEGNNPDAPGHFPEWLYQRKPVSAYLFDGKCIDIGTPEVYERVKNGFENVRHP
jgi:glucose-1-phosphate thymidylyltransferase